jgi:hypothetical protein
MYRSATIATIMIADRGMSCLSYVAFLVIFMGTAKTAAEPTAAAAARRDVNMSIVDDNEQLATDSGKQ